MTDGDNATVTAPAPCVPWQDAGVWERSGFAAFLADHGIQRSDLVASDLATPTGEELRFFRVKRSTVEQALTDGEVVARVEKALQRQQNDGDDDRIRDDGRHAIQPAPVPWVPGFFSLPASTRLASIDLYQQGELYGIDISSGYAVTLLDVQPGEHVLDLCCAPGAKLTMIADLLEMRGSVTGVDFSRPRINACKQLVHKYRLIRPPPSSSSTDTPEATGAWRCRLFHADGRSFSIGPQTEYTPQSSGSSGGTFEVVLDSDEISNRDVKSQSRKRNNKSARAREAKRLKGLVVAASAPAKPQDETTTLSQVLYDKVLVDAECTHDGSIKHLQKLQTEHAWTAYVADHLNGSEIQRILTLQAQLIRNGFALLRDGGTMVYSTCSLSVKQNEEIVRGFLADTPTATLLAIDTNGIPCEPGRLAGTVRFTPAHHTSGLFIAKIQKQKNEVKSST